MPQQHRTTPSVILTILAELPPTARRQTRCPSCGARRALTVGRGPDGSPYVSCKQQCRRGSVLGAAGLTMGDLRAVPLPSGTRAPADSELLRAALDYARRGWRAHPLIGKVAQVKDWPHEATTSERTIRRWWAANPDYSIGLAMGAETGLFVVDVDGQEGEASLERLEAEHGPLPMTLQQRTGKGRHLVFHWPAEGVGNSVRRLGAGLDTRGEGGYIVAAPSIHPETGEAYRWLNDLEPAEAPTWLLELLSAPPERQGGQGPTTAADGEPITDGQRNATLASLAGTMRRRGMGQEAITAALLAECDARCQPPLPEAEVRAIAASVARYEPAVPPRAGSPEQNGQAAGDAPDRGLRVSWGPDIRVVPIQFLWQGYIPLGSLGLLAGPPKVGKSTVATDLQARVSRGAPMPDGTPGREGRVLLIAPEDGESEALARYLEAGGDRERFGVVWEDLEDPDAQVPPTFPERLVELERLIREHGVLLVVIDNLDKVVGRKVEMNKAKDVTEVLAPLQAMAKRTGAAILAIEHTRKGGAGDPLDAVLGSRKVTGVARFVAFVVRDQDNPKQRLFGVRGNYTAEDDGTLRFTMSANGHKTTRIDWEGASGVSLQDAFRSENEGQGGALGEAIAWLRDYLSDGPRERKEVVAEAREMDVSDWALKEARRRLGIVPQRLEHEQGRPTVWELPTTEGGHDVSGGGHDDGRPPETDHPKELGV